MKEQQKIQEKLQEAIKLSLDETDSDNENRLLTSWVVIYELKSLSENERDSVGHLYGPNGTTTWDILGLIEWARRFTLEPDKDD